MPETTSISVKELFNHLTEIEKKPTRTVNLEVCKTAVDAEYGRIVKTVEGDGNTFYDFYDKEGRPVCFDGEEVEKVCSDDNSVTFYNANSDSEFKLSLAECDAAIFEAAPEQNIEKE